MTQDNQNPVPRTQQSGTGTKTTKETGSLTMKNTIRRISIACIMVTSVALCACGSDTDLYDGSEDYIGEQTESLQMTCTSDEAPNAFSLNPCDPTSDTAEDIILHSVGHESCLDNCLKALDNMTEECHARGLDRQRLSYCLAIASSAYTSCARSCPQVDFPKP